MYRLHIQNTFDLYLSETLRSESSYTAICFAEESCVLLHKPFLDSSNNIILAKAQHFVQVYMCSQRILRSACCSSTQSDQSLQGPLVVLCVYIYIYMCVCVCVCVFAVCGIRDSYFKVKAVVTIKLFATTVRIITL